MIREFNEHVKKNILVLIIITLVLELGFLFIFKSQLSLPKLAVCMTAILPAMGVLAFIFSSLENAFYAFALIVPLLPLAGYAALLVEKIKLQFILYVVFYALFIISIIKNGVLSKISKDVSINNKKRIMYSILIGFMFLNAVFAFSKKTSLMVFGLGILPVLVFYYLVKNVKFHKDKEEIVKNIFLCIFMGVALSGLPDIAKYVYANIVNLKLTHLGGPLGSNFVMAYSVIAYPFIIVNTKLEENSTRKNLYRLVLLIQTLVICCQRSRGLLAALIAMFVILFINYKHLKYYLMLIIIIVPCITSNIYRRPDVVEDIKIIEKAESNNSGEKINTFVKMQSSNRKPIWGSAAGIIKDNPVIGVGTGNFQYFFNIYAPSKYNNLNITFIDAHNFILNSAAELGIPFTILILIYFIYIIGIKSIVNIVRLPKNDKRVMMFIPLVSAAAAYFVFGNITGAAFQSVRAGDIVSFTPMFLFGFIIFYYHNVLSKIDVSK